MSAGLYSKDRIEQCKKQITDQLNDTENPPTDPKDVSVALTIDDLHPHIIRDTIRFQQGFSIFVLLLFVILTITVLLLSYSSPISSTYKTETGTGLTYKIKPSDIR